MISYAYEGAAMEKIEQTANNALQSLNNLGTDVPYIFLIHNQYIIKVTRQDNVDSIVGKWDELRRQEHDKSDRTIIDRAYAMGMSFK